MDELTKRYAKALSAEAAFAVTVADLETWVKAMEARAMADRIGADEKAPQWKVSATVDAALLGNPFYKRGRDTLSEARYAHAKAKARLAVVEDAVKRRRAREWEAR